MELVMARTMGMCSGVKRAISLAQKTLEQKERDPEARKDVSVTGLLVHNHRVTDTLASQGLRILDGQEIPAADSTVLIRAHGITDSRRRELAGRGATLCDATCPLVFHAQTAIRQAASQGRHIVIVGVPGHGETVAMMGVELADGTPVECTLVASAQDVQKLSPDKPITVFVQSTFPQGQWEDIERMLGETILSPNLVFGNSICPASLQRRREVLELCGACEAVIVIGGRHSSNTRALAQLVQERKIPVFHIENADEIPVSIVGYEIIGITAGASTPQEVISEVCVHLRSLAEAGGHPYKERVQS